jgi:hypothetical protein
MTLAERASARIRAIPLYASGPEWHPDMRVAQKVVEIAEMMRAECLRIIEQEAASDA